MYADGPFAPPRKELPILLDGYTVDCRVAGMGQPVLAVQDAGSDQSVWEPLRQQLETQCRFATYTPRAAGVAELVAVAETVSFAPINLFAWGSGGAVALHAALARPELFRSVMLYDPCIGNILRHVDGGREIELDFLREAGHGRAAACAAHLPDVTASLLSDLSLPALFLTGEASHPRYQIIVEWLAARCPAAWEAVLPGLCHDGPVRAPRTVAAEVMTFLHSL